jgi:O-antigen/teichoic acid export membrane protein
LTTAVAGPACIGTSAVSGGIGSISGASHGSLVRKGAAAFLDQVFFAGGHFATTIVLARWLSATEYGAFSAVFSWFFLLANAHSALITEPLMVFGVALEPSRFPGYLRRVLRGHWLLTGLFSAGLAVASALFWKAGSRPIASALSAAAAAVPLILLGWLLRRVCHLRFEFRRAATGSALSLVLILAGLSAAYNRAMISSPVAFAVIGLAGFVSWTLVVRPRNLNSEAASGSMLRGRIFAQHWAFGRWSLLAAGLSWLTGEVWSVVVPVFLGLPSLAAMAAAGNLFKPLHPLNQSISNLLLPLLSRSTGPGNDQGSIRPVRLTYMFLALAAGVTLVYGVAAAILARPLFGILYGNRYSPDGLMWPFVACYTATAINMVLSCAMKASCDTKALFRAWILPSALVLICSIPAIRLWGVEGALWTMAFGYWVAVWTAWGKFRAIYARGCW